MEPLRLLRSVRADKRGRKGYAAKLGYDQFLTSTRAPSRPELRPRLLRQDRHPSDGAERRHPFSRLLTAKWLALHRRAPVARRGRGREGITSAAVLTAHRVNSQVITQWRGNFDAGWPLPWPHASVWSRTALGTATATARTPDEPLLRRLRQHRVDDGAVRRYREYASMPGFRIDEIEAKTFAKTDHRGQPASCRLRVARLALPAPAVVAAGAVRVVLSTEPQSKARPRTSAASGRRSTSAYRCSTGTT